LVIHQAVLLPLNDLLEKSLSVDMTEEEIVHYLSVLCEICTRVDHDAKLLPLFFTQDSTTVTTATTTTTPNTIPSTSDAASTVGQAYKVGDSGRSKVLFVLLKHL
jgi:hypothetical protein